MEPWHTGPASPDRAGRGLLDSIRGGRVTVARLIRGTQEEMCTGVFEHVRSPFVRQPFHHVLWHVMSLTFRVTGLV